MNPILQRTAPLLILSSLAFAGFSSEAPPPWRGLADTEYSGWDCFTSEYAGQNLPDDAATSSDDAAIVQNVPGALITSTCNLYHPAGASQFTLTDTVPRDLQSAWLHVAAAGTPLLPSSVQLSFPLAAGGLMSLPPTAATLLAGGGGAPEEWLFQWDLALEVEDVRSYRIDFEASGAHMSLDSVLLDTNFSNPAEVGTNYCTSTPNSTGFAATISASGSDVLADGLLTLQAGPCPSGAAGIFFHGPSQGSLPFFNGYLCIQSGVSRYPVALVGPDQTLSHTVDFGHGSGASLTLGAVNFQAWFRDPAAGGAFADLSDGLALTFL
jgi:hypothetical protein